MILFKLSKPLLFFLITGFLFTACKKEEVNNDDQGYPIELTVSKQGRNVILSWTKTNISNFDGYFLVRSTEPIEDLSEPFGTFEIIDDFEQNTFEDTSFPLSEKVYYKVYVKVGERFLFSPTVSIEFDVNLLDFRANRMVHHADSELLFIFDNNQRKIFRYDISMAEVTDELFDNNTFDYIMAVGDAGLGPELYLAPNFSANIKIYDDKFNEKENIFINGGSVSSIEVGEGAYMVATNGFGQEMVIYDRSSLAAIEVSDFANGFDRRLSLLPGTPKKLIDISFDQLIQYELNSSWQILNTESIQIFTNPLLEAAVSSDGKHFIPNLEGHVYDLELNLVGVAAPGNNQFAQDYAFSKDGSKVYAFNFSPGEITEFSFPGMEEIQTIDLNYNPIRAFVANNGDLVVVGLVPEFFNQKTIVDVLSL